MNKGFTLVELLAVIVILGLLTIITSVSVTTLVKKSKNNLSDIQVKLIKDATKNYFAENMDKIPSENTCSYVTLKDLKEHGHISLDIVDPVSNKKISEYINIKIIANNKSLEYEVDSDNIEDCLNANIVLCRLEEGTANEIGSKYSCNLGKGSKVRDFYVLEPGTKNTFVTLILDGNYDKTTQPWCASGDNNSCKASGLKEKLKEISNDWLKLDENQIKIPSIEQIINADNQFYSDTINNISSKNSWLYNWPNNSNYGSNKPYGYWVSSTYEQNYAWYVHYSGIINNKSVNSDNQFGVRPIILITLDQIK